MERASAHLPAPGHSAIERASLLSKAAFSWVGPLIDRGVAGESIEDRDACFLVRREDDVFHLSARFDETYRQLELQHQVWLRHSSRHPQDLDRRGHPAATPAPRRSTAATRSTSRL